MEKNSRADRARQFMPFSPLRGYEELLREQQREVTPRRELSEYEAEILSKKMSRVEKGCVVRVVYYAEDSYVTQVGMVSDIDFVFRTLRVIKTVIPFDDVIDIEVERKP